MAAKTKSERFKEFLMGTVGLGIWARRCRPNLPVWLGKAGPRVTDIVLVTTLSGEMNWIRSIKIVGGLSDLRGRSHFLTVMIADVIPQFLLGFAFGQSRLIEKNPQARVVW